MYFSTFKNRSRYSHTSSTFSQKLLFVCIYCAMWGSLCKLDCFDSKIHCSFVHLEKWSTFSTEMLVTAHSLSPWNRKMSFKHLFLICNIIYFLKWDSNVRISWEIRNKASNFFVSEMYSKMHSLSRGNPRFICLFNYNIHGIMNQKGMKYLCIIVHNCVIIMYDPLLYCPTPYQLHEIITSYFSLWVTPNSLRSMVSTIHSQDCASYSLLNGYHAIKILYN